MQELRKEIFNFMEHNTTLHSLEEFIRQRDITLKNEKMTWPKYLMKMRQDREWADELVVRSTVFFLGKDIMLASYVHGQGDSWYYTVGRDKEWPFTISAPPSPWAIYI